MATASEGMERAPGIARWATRWRNGREVQGGGPRMAAGMVAALAYYYLVPNPLLALPGLVAFAALAWLRLDLALCLLPLTFPFWYVPKRALGQAVFPLSEIALGVCLAVAIGRLLLGWTRGYGEHANVKGLLRVLRVLRHRQWRWLVIGAALLLLGTASGVLIAVRPREALRAFRWEVAEPLLYAALLIACLWQRYAPSAAGTAGAHDIGPGGERARLSGRAIAWLAGPVLAVGALFGVLAIAQVLWLRVGFTPLAAGNHLMALTPAPGESLVRASGIYYGSANSLGALLERVLPLALALLLWRALPGAETEHTESAPSVFLIPPSSLLLSGCVLVMIAGLALSESRGAEVGAAAGLLLVLLAHPRTRRVAVGIVALGAVVALWQAGTLVQAALVGHGASGEVRLLLWQSALHLIRDHPLLGIGPDQFLYYYDPAYTAHPYWIPRVGGHLTPAALQPDLAHPHNLVLDLWLSGGVLGLAGFALGLGWLARTCWRIWRANRPLATPGSRSWTARTALVAGVAGGVFAGLTHGMVDSAYFQPDLALLFWWAVSLVALLRAGLPAPAPASEGMTDAGRHSERDARDRTISGTGRS